MPEYSYNVDLYDSMLKSEVIKLSIIAIVLLILWIAMIIYSIIQIKNEKAKKVPYIQLFGVIVVFIFLSISLGSQIFKFSKDIAEDAYLQYNGPANVRVEHNVTFGGIPTGYDEYIISFKNNGENIELSMRKDYGMDGDIENLHIVYSQNSKFILEIMHGSQALTK